MGEIGRQTIKGLGYIYIGVLVGFVTTALIFPHVLKTEEIGVLSLLVSYSQLIAVAGNLGFVSVVTRLFPYFKDRDQQHNGMVFLILVVSVLGFFISGVIYYFIEILFIAPNVDNQLFTQYSWYVYPLSLFTILFSQFDAYSRALGNAVTGSLIKEVSQRLLILLSIGGYVLLPLVQYSEFVAMYVGAFCSSGLLIILFLIKKGEFFVRPRLKFLRKNLRKVMVSVSVFGILGGFGNVVVQRVDSIMISNYLDLSLTGIYTTTFFFGAVILIPSRALNRISSTIIAQALKDKDLKRIDSVYKKSSLNQFILGVLCFVGIWGNIDNCFQILPKEFEAGKYVIFFIGLANVINLSVGVNFQLIQLSKFYRYVTYFLLVFCGLVVVTNLIFIPTFGITGAALASFASVSTYCLIRLIFIYRKFGIQPYQLKHIWVALVGVLSLLINYFLPVQDWFVFDIALRSLVMASFFTVLVWALKLSPEFNAFTLKYLRV